MNNFAKVLFFFIVKNFFSIFVDFFLSPLQDAFFAKLHAFTYFIDFQRLELYSKMIYQQSGFEIFFNNFCANIRYDATLGFIFGYFFSFLFDFFSFSKTKNPDFMPSDE